MKISPFVLVSVLAAAALSIVSCAPKEPGAPQEDASTPAEGDATGAAASSETPEADAQIEVLDVEAGEAASLVAEGKVAVLDVRTEEEFASAHIAGAVLANIRSEGFKAKVAELDQSKPYLVHCAAGASGGRSRKAVEALKEAGAVKVYHLNGGLNAWIQGEHPVEKGQ